MNSSRPPLAVSERTAQLARESLGQPMARRIDALCRLLAEEEARHQLAEREVADLRAEAGRLRSAFPEGIDPAMVRPMLRLLGPARMVLDRCAQRAPGFAEEAEGIAQRIVDWIGHPVTDEPAWATLPCEHPATIRFTGRFKAVIDTACRACRPCMARMVAGYAPGLVDGSPVIDEHPAGARR